MKGLFIDFYNPYNGRSFQEQAKTIVDLADPYLAKFAKIENFILEGGVVFGWQNQSTKGTDSPYAIGGGVTT